MKVGQRVLTYDVNKRVWGEGTLGEDKETHWLVKAEDNPYLYAKQSWMVQPWQEGILGCTLDSGVRVIEQNLKKPKKLYAVVRLDNHNYRIVKYLNLVGKAGFYERVLQMIRERSEIGVLMSLVDMLQLYSPLFLDSLVPLLRDIVEAL